MKNNKKWINLLLALVMTLSAIGAFAQGALEQSWQEEKNQILFEGDSVTLKGTGASSDGKVTTINQGGTYVLAGAYNGQIVVDAADKGQVTLVLDGLTLSAPNGPALWEKQSGGLALAGRYENGITVKEELIIESGTLTLTSKEKGLKAKNMHLNGGDVTINSEEDAINASGSTTITGGTYTLTCGDDGIHVDEDLLVQGGSITITTQNEGMEAARITIAGGSTAIYALDDGMNADGGDKTAVYKENGEKDGEAVQKNAYINIEGGENYISVSDGDGLDSNGNVMMSGGSLIIEGMENGMDVAIDYNGTFDLTGGRISALGGAQMGQTPTSENQSILVLYQAGEKEVPLTLQNALGGEVMTFIPQKGYQMVVLTHEDLTEGGTYTLLIGEETYTFENITKGINQLGQGGRNRGPGGRGGFPSFEGSQPPQGQRPDWPQGEAPPKPPEGFELPEGIEPPEGMEMPDGEAPEREAEKVAP